MKKKRIELIKSLIFFTFLVIFSAKSLVHAQSLNSNQINISLDQQWSFCPDKQASFDYYNVINTDCWNPIQVPANWYKAGHDLSGVVWYHLSFKQKISKDKRYFIKFNGVDYKAKVWLNGVYLGDHEGYFQPFEFEVSDSVYAQGANTLLVRVDSPLEQQGEDWSLNKRLIKGIFSHHDTRPGGAWSDRGQEKNTGGIWAPVELYSTGNASIKKVLITPTVNPDQSSSAKIELEVDYKGHDTKTIIFKSSLSAKNFSGPTDYQERKFELTPGVNKMRFVLPEKQYHLWHTWERGKPNLYDFQLQLSDENGVVSSKQTTTFGFRSIYRDKETGLWYLNGERFFLRGTNYISTQWMSEMDKNKFSYDVALMKQANINTVRVHAHIEAKEFYRQCDEAGLLIWQDFPLQWGYVDTEDFNQEAQKQVGDMVEAFYNHPSIIVWSLHNEPPWDATWMKWKYKNYVPAQNKVLDQDLYDHLLTFNDGRYKHIASTTGEHPWFGWYSGHWLDYGKPTKQNLVTEYGAQALPNIEHLSTIFNEDELWPDNDEEWKKWEYHNFQPHETFKNAKVSQGNTIEEFIYNTQFYQTRLIAFATEAYRRQKYSPVGGIFQFMFVEDWPSINWGIVDYSRVPKSGYFALQQAFQTLLPSIEYEKNQYALNEPVKIGLWVVNDRQESYQNVSYHYELKQKDKVVEFGQFNVDIKNDISQNIRSLIYYTLSKGYYQFNVELKDSSNKTMATNSIQFLIK